MLDDEVQERTDDVPMPETGPEPTARIVGEVQRLHPLVVTLNRTISWIVFCVLWVPLGIGVSGGTALTPLPLLIKLGVLAGVLLAWCGLAWMAHRWPMLSYNHASFQLGQERLEIRRGVLWQKVIAIPRNRVQHIDVNQGPIERRLGLGHLVIHTAGTVNAAVTLAGLAYASALEIRDFLAVTGSSDAV